MKITREEESKIKGTPEVSAPALTETPEQPAAAAKPEMCIRDRDEAILFAQQTGTSAQLTAGAKLRALIYGNDPDAVAFLKATEDVGLRRCV